MSVTSGSRYADVKTLRVVYHTEGLRWREVQFLTTLTASSLTLVDGLRAATMTTDNVETLQRLKADENKFSVAGESMTLEGRSQSATLSIADVRFTSRLRRAFGAVGLLGSDPSSLADTPDVADLVVYYTTADTLSNFDNSTPAKPYISTYSTYRELYDENGWRARKAGNAKSTVPALVNSGINFSETYVENGGGQENYSTFTVNIGYKSVTGSAYGLADSEGYWPPEAVVMSTIPNKGNFAGSASSEAQLPYNHIRITTYQDGWRRVHMSVNEISKDADPPADLIDPNTLAE